MQFSFKPLNLGEEFYQLLSFELVTEQENVPSARNDDANFSSEGVLHLASHDLRETVWHRFSTTCS